MTWQDWHDSLSWNQKLRHKVFHKQNRIEDVLCEYDWMPDWVFSPNIHRFFCEILRSHTWEVLYGGYVHTDKEACLLCGKTRSL